MKQQRIPADCEREYYYYCYSYSSTCVVSFVYADWLVLDILTFFFWEQPAVVLY